VYRFITIVKGRGYREAPRWVGVVRLLDEEEAEDQGYIVMLLFDKGGASMDRVSN